MFVCFLIRLLYGTINAPLVCLFFKKSLDAVWVTVFSTKYLELRYNKVTRLLVTFLAIIQTASMAVSKF